MKQVLVEVDDELLERLERFAPARSRQRSDFIRSALRRALWELEERATQEAYKKMPDTADDAYVDPAVWEPARPATRSPRRTARTGRRAR